MRRETVEPANPELSIDKPCKLLSISRISFHDRPKGEAALNLMRMRKSDEPFLETPGFAVRQLLGTVLRYALPASG